MVNLTIINRDLTMENKIVTAIAHPNIAFIKYWGNRDDALRIPLNGSISMNLDGLVTQTSVHFDPLLKMDKVKINGNPAAPGAFQRVSEFLDLVRDLAGIHTAARVDSLNNFPMGSGIASSASAFAALSLAASKAAGLSLDMPSLSRLARRGSGSACRSIPSGFVEWYAGTCDEDSFAEQLAPPDHWDLVDCLVVTNESHKTIGSSEGHRLSFSSPLQGVRCSDSARRNRQCRQAILHKDFESLAAVIEQDSNLMHSVMNTSIPELVYWTDETLNVIQAVGEMRRKGLPSAYTIDAGPNVHVITVNQFVNTVKVQLEQVPGVLRIVVASSGPGAQLLDTSGQPS
jgi:diphosphomevalonate decarboxylase